MAKEKTIDRVKRDWIKHYRSILTSPYSTKEQKELARKELLNLLERK